MGFFWEFTREQGLQPVLDETLHIRDDEEWDDWILRLGFDPKIFERSWGIMENFHLTQHQGKTPPYLFQWRIDAAINVIMTPDYPDYLEFLKSYLPLISQSLQINLLENFLDELAIPDDLARNVLKFVQCLTDASAEPSNMIRYMTHSRPQHPGPA